MLQESDSVAVVPAKDKPLTISLYANRLLPLKFAFPAPQADPAELVLPVRWIRSMHLVRSTSRTLKERCPFRRYPEFLADALPISLAGFLRLNFSLCFCVLAQPRLLAIVHKR